MAARRRKVRLSPFPPGGENCARSLAPPLPGEPASLGFAGRDGRLAKTPPGTAPDEHSVLIVAFPRTPITRDALLFVVASFPARKNRVAGLNSCRPTGGWGCKNCRYCGSASAPGSAEPTVLGPLTTGGPRASPTQPWKNFLKTVGEGLAPPAGRSRTGPYAKNAPASLFVVGAAHWAARRFIKTPAPDRSIPLLSGAVCLRENALSSPKVPPGCPGTPPSLL